MAQQDQIVRLIELGVAQTNTNYRDMMLALAALAQENARNRVSSGITAMTDSSGGTPGVGLAAVITPTDGTVDGATEFAPKAGFDTQIGLIEDAHEELRIKINQVISAINGGVGRTVQATAGAAADGTIAAITPTLTGATAGVVDAPTGKQQINNARNNQASLAAAINYCRVAVGLAPMPDNSGGEFVKSLTTYPMSDAAETAAGLTGSGTTLTLASVNAALTALQDNVATMNDMLDEAFGDIGIGPFVVATHNPKPRYVNADTTL